MPNRSYITGRAFEFVTRQFFERSGYYVMRSAGSHGTFDIAVFPMEESQDVGFDDHNPFVVQIKGLNFIALFQNNNLINYLNSRELNTFRITKFRTTLFKKYLMIFDSNNKKNLPLVFEYHNLQWLRIDANSYETILDKNRMSGQE